MQKSIKILKQPLWQKGLFLFISTLIIFKAGNCFSNDNTALNNNYEYLHLLYGNEEEARRIQLEQLQLTNETSVKKVKADYEIQQTDAKDKKYQEQILTGNIKSFKKRGQLPLRRDQLPLKIKKAVLTKKKQ